MLPQRVDAVNFIRAETTGTSTISSPGRAE